MRSSGTLRRSAYVAGRLAAFAMPLFYAPHDRFRDDPRRDQADYGGGGDVAGPVAEGEDAGEGDAGGEEEGEDAQGRAARAEDEHSGEGEGADGVAAGEGGGGAG